MDKSMFTPEELDNLREILRICDAKKTNQESLEFDQAACP